MGVDNLNAQEARRSKMNRLKMDCVSPEEISEENLQAQTSTARQIPEIVGIVAQAKSAQAVEDAVSWLEFPTSIVREARFLWRMKKYFPKAFETLIPKDAGSEVPDVRMFPCSYKLGDDCYGTMLVKPHSTLPPSFWEYALLDEEQKVVISTEKWKDGNRSHVGRGDILKCVLLHGSRSLPVALRISFKVDHNDGLITEFEVTGEETFFFTRHISVDRKTGLKTEWYGRYTGSTDDGLDSDSVSFHRLAEREVESLCDVTPREGEEYWGLTLKTWLNVPVNGEYLAVLLSTVYVIPPWHRHRQSTRPDGAFMMKKVEKARLPARDMDGPYFMWSPFVYHYTLGEHPRPGGRLLRESLEGEIAEILEHTPETINGLACLWRLFSFKKPSSRIYNFYSEEELLKSEHRLQDAPLPPWK